MPLTFAGLMLVAGIACAAMPGVTIQSSKASFDDVKERVVTQIENRGLIINYTSHVGTMLERTGKDIGRDRQLYSQAEVLEFCSAGLSRSTMEADPRNIVYCPYTIALYVLTSEPSRVYVSYRRPLATGSPQSMKALRAVGKLLDNIVGDALK